ncbi:MAG: c-type cytochrome, partial [Opitutus sp.]
SFLTPLLAQRGDSPAEIQAPVPAHWTIPPSPVLTSEEELGTFKVAPGFRVELVAAEPLIGDPVAAVFGPDGRLWVVEMRSYMQDIDGTDEQAPIGDVAVLEDTDGDGRFDKRTVFLDHLVMPRAVSLVGDGALVAEPPHLWFARDTNGDGVADVKTEVASNYGGTGNPEHMANGLVWMMDNWIYSANHTDRYRFVGGDHFLTEPTITRGQWGITQDDRGRIYYNSNSDPLRLDVVPSAYFSRNPNLKSPRGINFQVAPADLPTWPGRITPGVNRGYKTLRSDGTLPAVTAACSPVIYRGGVFPEEFAGDAFICEPSGNLVKRIRISERNGLTVGRNAYEGAEFLTSTDERFRPVSIYNGPDGALWVIDMYRGVIQHRTYVTSYLRAQVKSRGLEEGRGLGRIWRIVPQTMPVRPAAPNLAKASTAELVTQLSDRSGWVRDTAQRLLVERRDSLAVPALQSVIRHADASALAKLHALWTLDGMDALDRASVLLGLKDGDVTVATAAMRVGERWLRNANDAEVFESITSFGSGSSGAPSLILQQALSLGESASPRKLDAWLRIAEAYGQQPFVADAITSGLAGSEARFIDLATAQPDAGNARPVTAAAVRSLLNANDAASMLHVFELANVTEATWVREAVLDGIEAFLPRRADGKTVSANLAVEPTPLIALAARADVPESVRAGKLLGTLRWPGKPGEVARAAALTPNETVLFEHGRAQYAALCANCHQPQGQGLVGLAPPLVNSRWALGASELAASIVLCGKEDEGKVMPSLKGILDDQSIAAVLTFVRRSWGHDAAPVHIETVMKVRAETSSRTEPFHEPELVEIAQSSEKSVR